MNNKLIKASLAGAAAIAITAGGATFAAFSDFGTINNNSVGAGFLKLDLNAGTGSTTLNFQKLAPNSIHAVRAVWVASNDGQSVPNANLTMTFKNLQDIAGPCNTSLSKASVDPGCGTIQDVNGNPVVDPTKVNPTKGNLSSVLNFQTYDYPAATDPQTCQSLVANYTAGKGVSIFPANNPGDLATNINKPFELMQADGTTPLVLAPNQGVCVLVDTYWGPGTKASTTDNAAQGDSLLFDVQFDLNQVIP